MFTSTNREDRAEAAADPMTLSLRLKRPAFCPACGMGLQPFNVCFIQGAAFCKACGPDLSFVTQAAIQHLNTHMLAPFIICTDGLLWFTPPPEDLRGETIFTVLDTLLRNATPPAPLTDVRSLGRTSPTS